MNNAQTRRMLIDEYGHESVEIARILVELSDADGAWSEAMSQGLEDIAEIIEELYMQEA